jgi:hypothetical protein
MELPMDLRTNSVSSRTGGFKTACIFVVFLLGVALIPATALAQTQATFTVTKAYTEPQAWDPEVVIDLQCTGANIVSTNPATTSGKQATFTLEFPYYVNGPSGATCTATETAPAGYVQSASTCENVYVEDPQVPTKGYTVPDTPCTITNRPTAATFTVDKNYSDSNPVLAAAVTPLCTDAAGGPAITYSPANGNALQGTNYSTTVKYFNGATNCTASEANQTGYTQVLAQSTCDEGVALTDGSSPSCVIFNGQDPAQLTINVTGGGPVGLDITCSDGTIATPSSTTASEGNPAVIQVTDFPYDGASCSAAISSVPDGYTVTNNACTAVQTFLGNVELDCGIAIEPVPPRATFTVTKTFTDDDNGGPYNPTEVDVTISCFTGLPLIQTQAIDQKQSVTFVVESFKDGELDCNVSEDLDAPELAGYTPAYTYDGTPGGTETDEPCHFENVPAGAEYTCAIENDADPVPVEIEKDWIIEGSGGDQVNQYFELTLYCDAYIEGGSEVDTHSGYGGCGGKPVKNGRPPSPYQSCLELQGEGDTTFTPEVYPEWPSSHCWVDEEVYDDSAEVENGCDDINVSHGEGDSCLITNTVFFEGIPTLSQYGLAIMALLMLGVGLVGFRRFV